MQDDVLDLVASVEAVEKVNYTDESIAKYQCLAKVKSGLDHILRAPGAGGGGGQVCHGTELMAEVAYL